MTAGSIVGIFLAAGRGTRFASALSQPANKLLAPMPDGAPVVAHALRPFVQMCDEVIAVVGDLNTPVATLLRAGGARVLQAVEAHLGMGHSLAAGAREAQYRFPTLAGVLVGLADMPWLQTQTVRQVAAALREGGHTIVRARHADQAGHPVGFSATVMTELFDLTGDAGAREIMARHGGGLGYVDVPDAGCLLDVDRPEDIG